MPWVRAQLHGQAVYARAKLDGTLLIEGNRIEVCYSLHANRFYKARATNVQKQDDASILPDEACVPSAASGARLKRASSDKMASAKKRAQSTAMPKVSRDSIVAYCDGACSGNPGPAGLGVVILEGSIRTEISEPLGEGTNNIAELTAIERVLDTAPDPGRPLVIYTDSEYAIGVLSKGWKAKANVALVERVRERLAKRPATRLVHVRGHAGIELNERADELAREAVRTGRARTDRVG
jgi:ribonuclease HI